MLNAHNLCVFEGRIIKDPEYTSIQTSNGQMEKATFTIAVDRNLSTQQRQAARTPPG